MTPEVRQRLTKTRRSPGRGADPLAPSSMKNKALRRYVQEQELRPYQAELIKIRRVTRYMNEKHYRVVALGKATEHERRFEGRKADPLRQSRLNAIKVMW